METTIKDEVVVRSPIEEVWAYVSRMDLWPEWYVGLHDLSEFSRSEDQPGPTFTAKLDLGGVGTLDLEGIVLEAVPQRRWRCMTFGMVSSTSTWDYTPMQGATRIGVRLDYTVTGAMAALADALWIRRHVKTALAETLAHLRTNVELFPVDLLARRFEPPWIVPPREQAPPGAPRVRRLGRVDSVSTSLPTWRSPCSTTSDSPSPTSTSPRRSTSVPSRRSG